MQAKQ